MSHPSAPPPYEDRSPLYPGSLPPGGYGQPSVVPGGYPAYPQPGYGHPAGYPQPMPPVHPTAMNYDGVPLTAGAVGVHTPQWNHADGVFTPQPPPSQGHTTPYGPGYDGGERAVSDNFGSGDWDDRKVRHAFIRKVYTIISIQLLITVAIIAVFTFVKPVGDFVRANMGIYYASYAVFLVTYLTLICCQAPRRRFPWNIILLTLLTLAMGYMTGAIASVYNTRAVIIAVIITAVVSISVTIFCFQTKVDFTSCTGLFCVLGIVMMVTGIITAIVLAFKYVYWLHMVYAALGAICFTLFLAYDTQLVLGNRKHTISPEEYITGALQIYTDIVYIFTFVLQLVGSRD